VSKNIAETVFSTEQAVMGFIEQEIRQNGDAELAGIEEEIIVLNREGKPISHKAFQSLIFDLMNSLPEGKIVSGKTVHGEHLPVLKGTFKDGNVQPETNTTLVEFAHNPTRESWTCRKQSDDFHRTLEETTKHHDLVVIGGGTIPTMAWEDFHKNDVVIPNADFIYSWTHMANKTRPEYCRTVFGTASIHHNMGFNDPERMARYIMTALRLQPTMIAMTSNAPLWDNQRVSNGHGPLLSYRSHLQLDYGKIFGMDGVSYLYPSFLLDPDLNFEKTVNGYMSLPLDRTIAGGRKVVCGDMTMKDFIKTGFREGSSIFYPQESSLTMMLREPITDVRTSMTGSAPRVEARAHDCVSHPMAIALDAFYRGISTNLDEAQIVMKGLEGQEVRRQREQVCSMGLASPVVHREKTINTQQALALRMLEVAETGLIMRGLGEEQLLAPLQVIAQTGLNPAQRVLSVWKSDKKDELLASMNYGHRRFADGTTYRWPEKRPGTGNIKVNNSSKPSCAL